MVIETLYFNSEIQEIAQVRPKYRGKLKSTTQNLVHFYYVIYHRSRTNSITAKCIISMKLRKSNCRLRTRSASPLSCRDEKMLAPPSYSQKEIATGSAVAFTAAMNFAERSFAVGLSAMFSLRYSPTSAHASFYCFATN